MSRAKERTPLLQVESLGKSFGGLVAVDNLDFSVYHNEILGLIGPNGAGKSTTFHLISGFYKPTKGRVVLDGHHITGKRPVAISKLGLARTFQHESFFKDMTVYDNVYTAAIRFYSSKSERKKVIDEVLTKMNLLSLSTEIAVNLPHGYQRLLSIAIALVTKPKLLCLDEPLTGLNATELAQVLDMLRELKEEIGVSILFVEHNMKAVMQICDRIVVLNYGKKLTEGTPEEVQQDERVIEAYLGESLQK